MTRSTGCWRLRPCSRTGEGRGVADPVRRLRGASGELRDAVRGLHEDIDELCALMDRLMAHHGLKLPDQEACRQVALVAKPVEDAVGRVSQGGCC